MRGWKVTWLALSGTMVLGTAWGADSQSVEQRLQALLPKMIVLPAGSFKMGDIAGEGDANELPVHTVRLKSFAMSSTEVTFALYDLFAEATGRAKPNDEGWGRRNRPVINVSWVDATDFAAWLAKQTGRSFRLPSESEWEYAAHAGTETVYSSGDTITRDYANYGPTDCCAKGVGKSGRDKWDFTAPVGSFRPNPWGLYDTAGNVWEWTADCMNESYEGAPGDGSAWLSGDCTRAPLRGGSYTHYSRNIRPANRNTNLRTKAVEGYGIRLAESLHE